MVQEAYVSLETAKLLNEKWFVQKCRSYYLGNDENRWEHCYQEVIPKNETVYECPTQQMAMRWLREEHNLSIEISSCCTVLEGKAGESFWAARIIDRHKILDNPLLVGNRFSKYEEACEAAIKCCLENLI